MDFQSDMLPSDLLGSVFSGSTLTEVKSHPTLQSGSVGIPLKLIEAALEATHQGKARPPKKC